MRNSHNITFTRSDAFMVDDDATSAFPGRWSALCHGCWRWGSLFCFMALTRCFSSIRPFFLALMPVSVIIGIALHLLVKGKILFSIMFTLLAVGALFGALFIWLLG